MNINVCHTRTKFSQQFIHKTTWQIITRCRTQFWSTVLHVVICSYLFLRHAQECKCLMPSVASAVSNQSFKGIWNKLLTDIHICFPKLASWTRFNLNYIKPNSDRDCSSGQPVLGLCHHQNKDVSPHVWMELPMFQFVPIAPDAVTQHHWRESGLILLTPDIWILINNDKTPSVFSSPG